ncbi:hypothetical protein [Solicola sp. PLA-1-18]|uniref:hypothetical protein n=1 Tax=Solicola sp. PLA-1-18 TaxID=3380532 RepID=UPI003B804741
MRATSRAAGRRLVVHTRDGIPVHEESGARVTVARRDVVAAVRAALEVSPSRPGSVAVHVDDAQRLVSVAVEIVCAWDADLRLAAARAADDVRAAVVDVVGLDPAFDAERGVRVHVADVAPPA